MLAESAPACIYPPPGFKPAGPVTWAHFSKPWAIHHRRYSGARALGVRYEKKVQQYLEELFPADYVAGPWIRFSANGQLRWCQPDGLLFNLEEGTITIIEVKLQHTSDAWFQTKQLYQPVLARIFPTRLWRFEFCEVVKWFDPATPFPERAVLANSPAMSHPGFKVHIWRV